MRASFSIFIYNFLYIVNNKYYAIVKYYFIIPGIYKKKYYICLLSNKIVEFIYVFKNMRKEYIVEFIYIVYDLFIIQFNFLYAYVCV